MAFGKQWKKHRKPQRIAWGHYLRACKSVQFWTVSGPEKDFASRIQCWAVQPGSRDWRRWQCSQAMDFIKKFGGSPSYGSGKSLDFRHSSQQFIPHHHGWFPVVLVILWPTEPSFLEWAAGRREGITGDHAQRSLLLFQLLQQVWKQRLCSSTRCECQWESATNERKVQVRRCKQTFSCWIEIDMYTARQIFIFKSKIYKSSCITLLQYNVSITVLKDQLLRKVTKRIGYLHKLGPWTSQWCLFHVVRHGYKHNPHLTV